MAKRSKDFIQKIIELQKALPKIEKEISEIMYAEATADVQTIAKQEIENFYDSYTPRVYRRQYSLRNIYQNGVINNHDGDPTIDTDDPNLLSGHHRVDDVNPSYIHEYIFRGGWHGGADIDGNMLVPVSRYKPRELYSDENPPFNQVDMNGRKMWHWSPAKHSGMYPAANIETRIKNYYKNGDSVLGKSSSQVVHKAFYKVLNQYDIYRELQGGD